MKIAHIGLASYFTENMTYQDNQLTNQNVLDGHEVLMISNASKYEGGKVVEVKAEKGEELLKQMVSMDEGAGMLGECALIPYDSPINESGVLFYNTLFDENASCHLALGHGFNECLKGFEKLTDEECKARGINDSMIHVDFMIGSRDMSIVGITKDGKRVQIFENGNWAF